MNKISAICLRIKLKVFLKGLAIVVYTQLIIKIIKIMLNYAT